MVHGQVVLRKERPAIFCLVSSIFCCILAVIGMQVSFYHWVSPKNYVACWFLFSVPSPLTLFQTSTAGLLHISVFLALTLPALLVTTIPNPFEQLVPNRVLSAFCKSQMWNRCERARCLQLLLGWNSVENFWLALVIFAHTGEPCLLKILKRTTD